MPMMAEIIVVHAYIANALRPIREILVVSWMLAILTTNEENTSGMATILRLLKKIVPIGLR